MANLRDTPEFLSRASIKIEPEDAVHLKRLFSLPGTTERAVFGAPVSSDADLLYRKAQWIVGVRGQRRKLLPPAMFGEPAWDVLIHLYVAHDRERMSMTSVAYVTGVALTTLLRWVHYLSDQGLVETTKSPIDARMSFVDLTGKGLAIITSFLRGIPAMPD